MPRKVADSLQDAPATELLKQIGQRLAAVRKAAGLRQEDISGLLTVDQSTWSKWEQGKRLPDVMVVAKFARRAKVSLDLIYRGYPTGTHPTLLALLRATIPHLLVEDPTDTDPDRGKALSEYRNSIA